MNRITRCPSCATVYRLGDAQLQAANGWLRCGACNHVFDSTGLVLRWTPKPAEPPPVPAPTPSLQGAFVGVAQPPDVSDGALDSAQRIDLDLLLKKEDHSPTPEVRSVSSELDAFEEALSSFRPGPVPDEPLSGPDTARQQTPVGSKLAFWGGLGLVWLLLMQLAYVQREVMAASWPATEPVIRYVCQTLGCQVNPWLDVEGVVIDSSSLEQRSEDHVLTWSVRNTTRRVVGTTALELSLMDPQGRLILRTVILPAQSGAPPTLSPGQVWSGSLKVLVAPEMVFSDYRLLSFYP